MVKIFVHFLIQYIRKPFLIYDFAPDPIWISLHMRKILFPFLSVKWVYYRDGANGEGEDVGTAGDGDRHPRVFQGLTHRFSQRQP